MFCRAKVQSFCKTRHYQGYYRGCQTNKVFKLIYKFVYTLLILKISATAFLTGTFLT